MSYASYTCPGCRVAFADGRPACPCVVSNPAPAAQDLVGPTRPNLRGIRDWLTCEPGFIMPDETSLEKMLLATIDYTLALEADAVDQRERAVKLQRLALSLQASSIRDAEWLEHANRLLDAVALGPPHKSDCELGKELADGRTRIFVDSGGPLSYIDLTTQVYVNWTPPCTCDLVPPEPRRD